MCSKGSTWKLHAIPIRTPVRTTAGQFKLGIIQSRFRPLEEIELVRLRQNLLQGRPSLIFVTIDEISFAFPWQLAAIEARLKQVTGVQADFGGVSVWILGDLFRIRSCIAQCST